MTDPADRIFLEGVDFFEQKNYAGCIDKLEAYRQVGSNRDLLQEADYMLAYIAFTEGKKNAADLLADYLKEYQDSRHTDEVSFLIGTGYFEREEYDRAERWFGKPRVDVISDKHREALLSRLAYAQMQNQHYEHARANFAAAAEFGYEFSQPSIFYMAYLDYATGKYEDAMREFDRMKKDPVYREKANYYIAQINYLEENHDDVVTLTERLLRTYPKSDSNPELHRIAGN
ncbi:MAG: hypothetical protein LBT35_05145, partial [Tannerella sp.]|nr:hypothetical protein [Tannerella sp.]